MVVMVKLMLTIFFKVDNLNGESGRMTHTIHKELVILLKNSKY